MPKKWQRFEQFTFSDGMSYVGGLFTPFAGISKLIETVNFFSKN